jgi:hypothetical protein
VTWKFSIQGNEGEDQTITGLGTLTTYYRLTAAPAPPTSAPEKKSKKKAVTPTPKTTPKAGSKTPQ